MIITRETIRLTLDLPQDKAISVHNEYEGFNPRIEGATLANGDLATGDVSYSDYEFWYVVTDSNGNKYETREQPAIRIDLTNVLEVNADGILCLKHKPIYQPIS